MNVVVTGAGGFIGRHVVRRLTEAGHTVHPLTRRTCDLNDPASVREAIAAATPDGAIHLAWYVEPGRWKDDIRRNLASLSATVGLLCVLIDSGCSRIVLAGSGVEGLDLDSTYAVAKRAVHDVAQHLAKHGEGVVCAHLFGVFGPGEDPRRVVPIAVNALLRGEPVDLTDGRQRRDALYVEDVASALVAILTSRVTGTIDVVRGAPIELRSLLLAMAEHTGRPELLRFGARPYFPDEITTYGGDSSQLQSLGWAPEYDLSSAARETVRWWRASASVTG